MTWVLSIAGAVVTVDQITKALARESLVPGVPIDLIDGLLALTLIMNPGLAFGILGAAGPGSWWMMTLLSLGALIVLIHIARGLLFTGGWIPHVAIGLILGGAAGNLIDRALWGAVTDFVDLHWRGYHWPAFNTADSAISIGVVLLALSLWRKESAR